MINDMCPNLVKMKNGQVQIKYQLRTANGSNLILNRPQRDSIVSNLDFLFILMKIALNNIVNLQIVNISEATHIRMNKKYFISKLLTTKTP